MGRGYSLVQNCHQLLRLQPCWQADPTKKALFIVSTFSANALSPLCPSMHWRTKRRWRIDVQSGDDGSQENHWILQPIRIYRNLAQILTYSGIRPPPQNLNFLFFFISISQICPPPHNWFFQLERPWADLRQITVVIKLRFIPYYCNVQSQCTYTYISTCILQEDIKAHKNTQTTVHTRKYYVLPID